MFYDSNFIRMGLFPKVLTNQIYLVCYPFPSLAQNYFWYYAVKKQLPVLGLVAVGLTAHTPAILISEETTAVATEDQQRSLYFIQTFTVAEIKTTRREKHNSGETANCGGGC